MSTIVLNSSINILPIFLAQRERRLFQNVDGMKSERGDDEQKSRPTRAHTRRDTLISVFSVIRKHFH
jgi:hypothetical protein